MQRPGLFCISSSSRTCPVLSVMSKPTVLIDPQPRTVDLIFDAVAQRGCARLRILQCSTGARCLLTTTGNSEAASKEGGHGIVIIQLESKNKILRLQNENVN